MATKMCFLSKLHGKVQMFRLKIIILHGVMSRVLDAYTLHNILYF